MAQAAISLTPYQYKILQKLRNKIGYKTVLLAVAVDTLVDNRRSDDSDLRTEAYNTIVALKDAGVLEYNDHVEQVTILDVQIQIVGENGVPVSKSESDKAISSSESCSSNNIDKYFERIVESRIQCIEEIVAIHMDYGKSHGYLPPKLASMISRNLRKRHPHDPKVLNAASVASFINHLLNCGFLALVNGERGVYCVTKKGLISWNNSAHVVGQKAAKTMLPAT